MSTHKPLYRTVSLLLLCAVIGACATGGPSGGQSERRAESLANSGQHADAAAMYIGLATGMSGTERDRLTLLAVEQWLDAGDGYRARNAFREVARPVDRELLWLWSTNSAALALWDGRPDDALSILEPMSLQALPQQQRASVEALRADAWFQKDEPARAVDLYVQRENWLDGRAAIETNRRRLWLGLLVSDVQVLRKAAETAFDPVVRGWLTLGSLAVSTGEQGVGWSNGVIRWQEGNVGHPAESILAKLDLPQGGLLDYPRQIALLLPLSGSNAAAGSAIQNGFFGAYFSAAAGLEDQQQVRVYDVTAAGGATDAYAQAIADGADFVVGPLLPRSVADLASELILPVPVLALNNLRPPQEAPPDLYQFALAPEHEAASAASRAISDGRKHALALYPDNDWGSRVISSFASEFEAAGGVLLDHQRYTPGDPDFSVEIRNVLAISQSMQRHRRLQANLRLEIDFEPRRRQDVDLIFLAANAKSGRLLSSQLKFHDAGDLQIYSTSYIYSMDGRSDRDLNGVMFADAPWVIAPPAWIADFPQLFQEFWPAEKRLGRLHALGYDAYQLVAPLYGGRTAAMQEIVGATGRLTLDENGRVRRQLAWAQFERGEPIALPEPPVFDFPLDDFDADTLQEQPQTWPQQRTLE